MRIWTAMGFLGLLAGCGGSQGHRGHGAEFVFFGSDDDEDEQAPCPLQLEGDEPCETRSHDEHR